MLVTGSPPRLRWHYKGDNRIQKPCGKFWASLLGSRLLGKKIALSFIMFVHQHHGLDVPWLLQNNSSPVTSHWTANADNGVNENKRLESVPNYCIINHSNLHITVFNEGCLLRERFHISHILKVIFFNSVVCVTIRSVNSSSYLFCLLYFCGKSACLWVSPLCDVTKGSEDSLKLSCINDNTPSQQPPCYLCFLFFFSYMWKRQQSKSF